MVEQLFFMRRRHRLHDHRVPLRSICRRRPLPVVIPPALNVFRRREEQPRRGICFFVFVWTAALSHRTNHYQELYFDKLLKTNKMTLGIARTDHGRGL